MLCDVNLKVLNSSTSSLSEISRLDFAKKSCTIGTGVAQTFNDLVFEPKETLDASLDEFRFWKNVRNQQQINEFYQKNVFQQEDLAVYYRFNEPTGSFANQSLVLDHSGNGLHGSISNFATTESVRFGWRQTGGKVQKYTERDRQKNERLTEK